MQHSLHLLHLNKEFFTVQNINMHICVQILQKEIQVCGKANAVQVIRGWLHAKYTLSVHTQVCMIAHGALSSYLIVHFFGLHELMFICVALKYKHGALQSQRVF